MRIDNIFTLKPRTSSVIDKARLNLLAKPLLLSITLLFLNIGFINHLVTAETHNISIKIDKTQHSLKIPISVDNVPS